ncbi:MAG: hypothetical protein GEEBNDBF_02098 [bacterium]|nr:hypothetical protein [bacterium]
MRQTLAPLSGALLLSALAFAGCGGGSQVPATSAGPELIAPKPAPEARGAMTLNGGPANTTDLIAGKHYDAGDIEVTNDGDNLYVRYTLAAGWTMSEAHLYVGTSLPSKTAPGQFPYKVSNLGGVTEYTFTVPLSWECGTEIYLAAHAVVTDSSVGGAGTQTGWGFGPLAFKKAWGWFMTYSVEPVCELPEQTISFKVAHPYGSIAYFKTRFTGIGAGYSVMDNTDYAGWCVDLFHNITPGTQYTGKLYSSYDNNLPADLQDDDWDLVNYLLNHKQGTRDDIQKAIWYFIGGGTYPTSAAAQAMIADAQANGEGYVPPAGKITAVVVDPDQNVQITIIETVCDC